MGPCIKWTFKSTLLGLTNNFSIIIFRNIDKQFLRLNFFTFKETVGSHLKVP